MAARFNETLTDALLERALATLRAAGVKERNLTVVRVDAERQLLLVKGAIPGPVGCIVLIREAAKGAAK